MTDCDRGAVGDRLVSVVTPGSPVGAVNGRRLGSTSCCANGRSAVSREPLRHHRQRGLRRVDSRRAALSHLALDTLAWEPLSLIPQCRPASARGTTSLRVRQQRSGPGQGRPLSSGIVAHASGCPRTPHHRLRQSGQADTAAAALRIAPTGLDAALTSRDSTPTGLAGCGAGTSTAAGGRGASPGAVRYIEDELRQPPAAIGRRQILRAVAA
jgi:hypothetical protein